MKRRLINKLPPTLPRELLDLFKNADVYDSSCSPEAKVFFVDRDGGYYLKTSAAGKLAGEAKLDRYFYKKGLGADVIHYSTADVDWLVTSRVEGEDCTYCEYIENPKRLCDTIAEALRKLHETDFSDCPVQNRMTDYFSLAEENYRTGNYDKSSFPDSFGYASSEKAWRVLEEGRAFLDGRVLLHGDYCLPNIMLDSWKLSGFIDLGNGGVGDRHIDLFWGAWTLWFNLKTDKYRNRFFDAYGRDKVDEDKIKIIAAAEVFG